MVVRLSLVGDSVGVADREAESEVGVWDGDEVGTVGEWEGFLVGLALG